MAPRHMAVNQPKLTTNIMKDYKIRAYVIGYGIALAIAILSSL